MANPRSKSRALPNGSARVVAGGIRALVVGGAVLLGGVGARGTAAAAQLELASSASGPVAVGQRFEVAVSGVAFPNGTDGGDLSLFWSDNLAFVGLSVENAPWETSAADLGNTTDHYVGSVDVFSADDTPGTGGARFPIARLTLEAQAEGPARIDLGVNLVGWSLDGNAVDYVIGPAVELDVVPEPSLAATLAAGCGLLGALGRLRRPSPKRRRS